MRKFSRPPSSLVRYCGTIIIADILGYLVIGALPVELLPEKSLPHLCALLAPLAVAIGNWIIHCRDSLSDNHFHQACTLSATSVATKAPSDGRCLAPI